MLRQPIITVLGHVDHGKTSFLDTVRRTAIASKEAGGITQAIGTTEIPSDTIKKLCGNLLDRFKFDVSVPGLLFVDTPGHEAFTTLRKRGSSIADIAILVIDIKEGVMPQTVESLQILKESKTPFVVAMNKIDRIEGWSNGVSFIDSFNSQNDDVKNSLETEFYAVAQQLSGLGFNVDRYDRIQDFTKTIAAVPISAKTGEGISDLLVVILGLTQQFLKNQLVKTDKAEGMILEVKEVIGLGTTVDCIIYDGTVTKNDYLVIGGSNIISKIKALLMPDVLRDIRTEKKFTAVPMVTAACGVKIAAPGLENVIAGSPIMTAKTFEDAQKLLNELENEQEAVEIHTEKEGIVLKADTIGCIEALINVFKMFPIKDACIGQITKQDIIRVQSNKDPFQRVIVGFEVSINEEVRIFAKESSVRIIESNVVYHLIEDYTKWMNEEKENIKKEEIKSLQRACKLKIIPGCIFRASNPAIVGCEIIGGILKPGAAILKDGKEVGEVKQIQVNGENTEEAKIGDKVAVSMIGPTVGRQIDESDILYTNVTTEDYKKLLKHAKIINQHEITVLEELKIIKRKTDPRWGM